MAEKVNETGVEILEQTESSETVDIPDASSEIANFMWGVEDIKISEKKEKKWDNVPSKSKKKIKKVVKKHFVPVPSTKIQRSRVLSKLKEDTHNLIKNLNKSVENPHEFTEKVKKIRSLRQRSFDMVRATLEKIKSVYMKFFWYKHWEEDWINWLAA